MAQAFRRLGSRVTVIEQAPQLAPREDPDVAEAVRAIFADDGIDVVLEAAIDAIEGRSGNQVHLSVLGRRKRISLTGALEEPFPPSDPVATGHVAPKPTARQDFDLREFTWPT
jgi:NADPH-dependent 2,4-dienoyl-CoA reductase/sulfur reductase-like enzyme